MVEVIGVRFKKVGRIYYFAPNSQKFEIGTKVIVETSKGIEYGNVIMANKFIGEEEIVSPLKTIIRIATIEDEQTIIGNRKKEEYAFGLCCEKILLHSLPMKLVSVEYAFDSSRILFYFTSDGRVDFRDLVKDLASIFKTRIELRQIGVRDEAKMLGGIGICGRELCCSSFLDDFQPVSINMAKDQGLPLNPNKISGACGRLMCCLKYEQETYEHLKKVTPNVNSVVTTPDGNGVVLETNMLRGTCKVKLDNDETAQTFSCSQCRCKNRGKK